MDPVRCFYCGSTETFCVEGDPIECRHFVIHQRGGDKPDVINQPHHYARRKMQPIEYIAANDMEWWEANVVKYIARYDAKDGLQDLYKARSYLDMKIRQLEGEARFWEKGDERNNLKLVSSSGR